MTESLKEKYTQNPIEAGFKHKFPQSSLLLFVFQRADHLTRFILTEILPFVNNVSFLEKISS